MNITPVVQKIVNIIKTWGQRKLTLYGKTTIMKSLLESQLIYTLSVLPSPDLSIMEEIDKALFDFLWDKKPHKIAKKEIIKPKNQTGLAIVDFYTKIRHLK